MSITNTFKSLSWDVDEPTYRADPAYSYSQLSRYLGTGFEGIEHINDKVSSPSLTFGSMVDTLLTDGKEAFDNRFYIVTMPSVSDTVATIVNSLSTLYSEKYNSLCTIPSNNILEVLNTFNYQPRWREETRVKDIIEKGSKYYDVLFLSQGKEVVSSEMYDDAVSCVEILKTNQSTKWYFQDNNPFEDIERLYQLKFKGNYKGIQLRCMADLILVDHKNKAVYPCDLKTSFDPEWKFYKNFIKWHYYIQAQLYYKLIRDTMDKDPYFKDFKLANYRFIVISRGTKNPRVWEWGNTATVGEYTVGNVKIPDWRNLVEELNYYMTYKPNAPIGITTGLNDLEEWIKKEM